MQRARELVTELGVVARYESKLLDGNADLDSGREPPLLKTDPQLS